MGKLSQHATRRTSPKPNKRRAILTKRGAIAIEEGYRPLERSICNALRENQKRSKWGWNSRCCYSPDPGKTNHIMLAATFLHNWDGVCHIRPGIYSNRHLIRLHVSHIVSRSDEGAALSFHHNIAVVPHRYLAATRGRVDKVRQKAIASLFRQIIGKAFGMIHLLAIWLFGSEVSKEKAWVMMFWYQRRRKLFWRL